MNNTPASAPANPKRRRWPLRLALLSGALALLLGVAYFVVTSAGFLKGFVLPRVNQAVHATVTVEDAAISPFRQVVLKNLKVQTTGGEPVLTAAELRMRYHLLDILRGHINVDEITLASPVLNLVRNADGTSNLDPLPKSAATKDPPPSPTKAAPPQFNLKKLTVANATLRHTQHHAAGGHDLTELANINLTLTDLKNGDVARLALGADIRLDQQPATPVAAGSLAARLTGDFTFKLTANLQPAAARGTARLEVSQASGAMKELAMLAAAFDCDITPAEINQLAVQFQKAGTPLGNVRVSGPFALEKTEGRLNVELARLNRQVLNLAGAASGLDFGGTTINSTNQIELTKAGTVIKAGGRFTADHLQITRAAQTTPALDLRADYSVTVDRAARTAQVRTLAVTGTQNQQPLLRADLDQPMTLAWGDTAENIGDAVLKLQVAGLHLPDWRPFLGDAVSGGDVTLQARLVSQAGGKRLAFELDSQIANLTAHAGSNVVSQADLTLAARGQVVELKQFTLDSYGATLARGGETLLTTTGSASYDSARAAADLQVKAQAALTDLLRLAPQPNVNLSSGTLDLAARITQQAQTQTITGTLDLAALTGSVGANTFRDYGVRADLDVTKTGAQIEIRRATGQLTSGATTGGSFEVSGRFDSASNSGTLNARLTDCDQNGLRPFLEPLLGGKQLAIVALSATVAAKFDAARESSVHTDARVTNLVVRDPVGKFPATPLEARLQLDASLRQQVTDLRQCVLTLTPTARAKNELKLSGRVDATRTNAITGQLTLAADALDLTSYCDLFCGKTAEQPASATPAALRGQELEAVRLPFKDFTVAATVGRLYLHEVDVADFRTTLKLDGGRVLLQPIQLSLNGAPVRATADLNLGVPGYEYDVDFSAQNVPIAPLANTFSPAYKNQASGELFAAGKIKGAGVTGVSLQKTLTGNASIALTNANIRLVGPKSKSLVTPIALVLGLEELTRTPLNGLNTQLRMGGGQIALTECNVRGDTFRADVTGALPIAAVLNDSRFNNWPINIALTRQLAAKARLLSSDTPTNAVFVQLPTFAKLGGTLGKPEAKTDKLVIAGLIARSAGGIPGVVGGDAGKVLQGLGNLLGGQTKAVEGDTATNAPTAEGTPPMQQNQPLNLFDLLRKR